MLAREVPGADSPPACRRPLSPSTHLVEKERGEREGELSGDSLQRGPDLVMRTLLS